jgi:hypothetical protein
MACSHRNCVWEHGLLTHTHTHICCVSRALLSHNMFGVDGGTAVAATLAASAPGASETVLAIAAVFAAVAMSGISPEGQFLPGRTIAVDRPQGLGYLRLGPAKAPGTHTMPFARARSSRSSPSPPPPTLPSLALYCLLLLPSLLLPLPTGNNIAAMRSQLVWLPLSSLCRA